jgi:glycerophosphoryl diester phosphodiesterase
MNFSQSTNRYAVFDFHKGEVMNAQNNETIVKTGSNKKRRRGFGCLLVLFVLLAIPLLYYGFYFAFRGPRPSNPQLIAHRGGPAYEPENTIAAFEHANMVGSDWIEMDVQRSQDGILVVVHDETVDRTTNGTGEVGELTWEQLQALDAGNGQKIPTFAEVITLAKEADIGLLPEAKSPELYPGIEAEIVQEIVDGGYVDATVVQSFKPETLLKVREINSEISVCPLYGLWQFDLSDPPTDDIDKLCPMAEMIVLNPWMIKQAHDADREVFIWFGALENPLMMRFMLALGADGLMVDDPDALADILGR